MAEYAFFTQKADRWRKDMAPLWGNLNICHQICWLELPCHTQAELSSLNSLKVWGDIQKPCHDITFLLVQVEDAMGDRHYGISIVWAKPGQVRDASMEEAVKKLTACTSSGTDWLYALVHLHEGTHHVPLPREGHLGIIPQRGVEVIPCGQISQLEVCQPLAASPQVIYPIGLNGQDEPILTSLPEPLASGINLTAGEPMFLGLDIPSPPMEEPDQKILPLGEVSTILIASPHKSSPKSEGSMTTEVRDLLSRAMLEMSSCRSEHSSPRRPAPVVVPMAPPQKPEGPLWLVDTSLPPVIIRRNRTRWALRWQKPLLEDIPTSISQIAAISRTRSITPLVDELELQANANKALKDFLTTKASIDACRQRAIWDLSIVLHQSESQTAESIKEAKAACSQATLDAQTNYSWLTLEAKTNCSWVILEAKTACSMAVKKAKTTRGHMKSKLPVPKPSARSRPGGPLKLHHSKGSMTTSCGTWRNNSSKRRTEVEPTSSPPVKSPCTSVHQSLKALWLLPTISYYGKHLHYLHLPCCRELPLWKDSSLLPPLPTSAWAAS